MPVQGDAATNTAGVLNVPGKPGSLLFNFLPAYAVFLQQDFVAKLAAVQLKLMHEMDVPILKYFLGMPDEQLISLGEQRIKYFLQMLADNKAEEYINESLRTWVDGQLPLISRDKIQPEDLTLINFIRRVLMRAFLPDYTIDAGLMINILHEIDLFTTESETRSFKILISIQQELNNQTQELAQIGNWVWDLAKGQITWSDELFRIYELPPQNTITQNLSAFNHPDDAQMILDEMANSKKTGQPHDFYYRIILPGGREKYLHAKGRVRVNEQGTAYQMFGTLQDVTQQRMLERELKEQQAIIQKIADLTPSMIAAYNIKTGRYLFINRAIATVLGYTQQEVMEKGVPFLAALMHPDDIAGVMSKNDAALQRANRNVGAGYDEVVEFLYRLKHADGNYRWMQTFGTVFSRNSKGEVEEVINISIDVSSQVKTAQQLKTSLEELEEKNKELEAFTYIASHDLQEPLRKIKFFIQQGHAKKDEGSQENYVSRIDTEVSRMQLMINGLLQYSQMAEHEKQFEPVSLNTVLDDAKNDLGEMIADKNAMIESAALPTVNGLQLQLQQLFVNLISNALKYSKPNQAPHIQISYGLADAKGILPNVATAHKITFADNGIGFEDKYAQHIFELFRRLHNKTAYPGTGVGLTICKKIVENHNGTISANGVPGKGATFHVYLPAE